jgi:hypothetical protein
MCTGCLQILPHSYVEHPQTLVSDGALEQSAMGTKGRWYECMYLASVCDSLFSSWMDTEETSKLLASLLDFCMRPHSSHPLLYMSLSPSSRVKSSSHCTSTMSSHAPSLPLPHCKRLHVSPSPVTQSHLHFLALLSLPLHQLILDSPFSMP